MVGRVATLLALALLAVAIGACFSLSFSNGSIACSDDPARPCPAGYECVRDRCWSVFTPIDGGVD